MPIASIPDPLSSVARESPQALAAPLRVLHLEDNPDDAELIRACLEKDGLTVETHLARTQAQFLAALQTDSFDLVLADYNLPDYDGLKALQHVRTHYPELPFILVSGVLGEEFAIESLKRGATDYVLKTRPARLPAAVRRAVHEAEQERQYRQIQERWRESQNLFRQIMENVDDFVAVLDLNGKRIFTSPSFQRLLGTACAMGSDSFENIHPEDAPRIREIFAQTAASGVGERSEYRLLLATGQIRFIESQGSVIRNEEGTITNVLVLSRDITDRKNSELRLAELQRELLDVSRLAGMAEVATGVLHNVGNVLNSVNVASHYLADCLRKSKTDRLSKVVTLLQEQEGDLPAFFASPRGLQVPAYLAELSSCLKAEQTDALGELKGLQKNIEHIKTIVSMQQRFAQTSGHLESVQVNDLLEDALLLNSTALDRHSIRVVKEFDPVPPINVPKHQVLQILVNLIRNAHYACRDSNRDDKQMTLRVMGRPDRVAISVSDNGVGISPQNLTKIFAHGFTTRQDGHGFGLHSGALAAKEMGGSLQVFSAGPGQGATFTLEIPAHTPPTPPVV